MEHPSSRDIDLESGLATNSDEDLCSKPTMGIGEDLGPEKNKNNKENKKEKRNSNNKKPPRPPRGPSLDAADQKLIREIAELAMLKRARADRIKKIKASKSSSSSSSSGTSLFALVFTLLFCLLILFHGMSCRNSPENLKESPNDSGLISVQFYPIPSAVIPNGPGSESPNMVEQVSGADPQEKVTR